MTLEFYQIYFKDEQLDKLYPFAKPYKNEQLSPYFENQVIADIVPNTQADLVSVCSWRLAQKRGEGAAEAILKRNGTFTLTEEIILSADFDIAILTPRNHKDIVDACPGFVDNLTAHNAAVDDGDFDTRRSRPRQPYQKERHHNGCAQPHALGHCKVGRRLRPRNQICAGGQAHKISLWL